MQSLSREIGKILQTPEVKKRMAQDEIEIKLMTPEAFTKYIDGRDRALEPAREVAQRRERIAE